MRNGARIRRWRRRCGERARPESLLGVPPAPFDEVAKELFALGLGQGRLAFVMRGGRLRACPRRGRRRCASPRRGRRLLALLRRGRRRRALPRRGRGAMAARLSRLGGDSFRCLAYAASPDGGHGAGHDIVVDAAGRSAAVRGLDAPSTFACGRVESVGGVRVETHGRNEGCRCREQMQQAGRRSAQARDGVGHAGLNVAEIRSCRRDIMHFAAGAHGAIVRKDTPIPLIHDGRRPPPLKHGSASRSCQHLGGTAA